MAPKKRSLTNEFSKGLVRENPVLRLILGTCPTLAVTTSTKNASAWAWLRLLSWSDRT